MTDDDIDLNDFLSFARGPAVDRLIVLMNRVKIPDLTVLEILDIVAAFEQAHARMGTAAPVLALYRCDGDRMRP